MYRLLILLLFLCPLPSNAASTTAVLDVDRIITNSVAYQKFKVSWDKNSEKYQKEIESYESKMISLDKEISSKSRENNKQELDKLKIQLAEYEFTIQKLVEQRKGMLDKSFSTALSEIRTDIMKLVENYSKQHNISLVIPKSQTIYTSNTIEITDIILTQLNNTLKTIVNFNDGTAK